MEAVDQALALCSEDGGPPHVKLVLEWSEESKKEIIGDDHDLIEEHASVKVLRAQALQGGAPLTLEECLRDYTEAETLTDAWRCPHCQQYQPVVKTLDVWSLPDILVVHFKRFRQQSLRGCNSTKLTSMVDFPVNGLDMSPHLANKRNANLNRNGPLNDSDNSMIINNTWSPWKRSRKQSSSEDNLYDLYAVCYHHGTDLETGHYTAACKNSYDNTWYLYDDAKVDSLSKNEEDMNSLLVNNSAYILFYQKRNGAYVGSSCNSSSAASTSSVGSSLDHWVARMPRYTPPKTARVATVERPKPVVNVNGNDTKADEDEVAERGNSGSNVSLRVNSAVEKKEECAAVEIVSSTDCEKNASNLSITRHSLDSANRKSVNSLNSTGSNNNRRSHDARDTVAIENMRNSPTLSHLSDKKPVYTTSIYINSTGDGSMRNSPVLSMHRIDGALEQPEDDVKRREVRPEVTVYTTTAAVHRYSDMSPRISSSVSRTQLNWMSPQPARKLNTSQQSV
ncbi:unnamed protein product [Brassicogethes aeneus]|uniref:ubiquitinyl hydrolase 1 n=1 Tax=Brassicogethes aeneus TaxID=1431903 RepID=A0A9P0BLZ7_BRAAE|nr:unnamed protein product [Brassicogethes aeneus]